MKTASVALQTALIAGGSFVPVELYEVSLVDGTVWYLTSFDYPVVYTGSGPRNGRVYQPNLIQRSNFSQHRGSGATKFQLVVANKPGDTTFEGMGLAQNVLSGRWIGATIYWLRGIGYTLPVGGTQAQVSEAPVMHFGRAGDVQQDRSLVTIDVNSPMELMNMDVPWRVLGPECRWTLYDSNCQANPASFSATATVLAGSSQSQLLCGLSQPTGYFDQGVLVWLTGANNGLRGTVRSFIGTGLASAYYNLVIADKPLAYYRFATSSLGADSSGHGYTATVNGSPTFNATGGPLAGGSGYAFFHGNPDVLTLPVPSPRSQPNFQAAVSFEFWFNVTGKQPNGLFGSGASPHNAGLWNFSSTSQPNPGFKWGQNHPYADFTAITGAWVHCAVVFRGNRFIDIYLNGYLSVTVDDFGNDNWDWTGPTIGRASLPTSYNAPGGNTQWFVGGVAEFAIYAYAMDAGQVFDHYQSAQPPPPVSAPSAELNLVMPATNMPATGDTFTVYAGCPKSLRACVNIFNNKIHFGGAPFIPPSNQAG